MKLNAPVSKQGSRNAHWDFVPDSASISVPQAKVYLRSPEEEVNVANRPSEAKRYRITLSVLALEDAERPWDDIHIGLFVVKGNPLVASVAPLPCFASGSDSVLLDVRENETVDDLTLQVVVTDMGAHFGIPIDELLDLASSREGVERSISLWDTQTGAMRGSCLVKLKVELERPLSISDLFSMRRGSSALPPASNSPVAASPPEVVALLVPSGAPSGNRTPQSATNVNPPQSGDLTARSAASVKSAPRSARDKVVEEPVAVPAEPDLWTQWTQNLLGPARAVPVEEKVAEQKIVEGPTPGVSPGGRRRRGGAPTNFALNGDVINTVIPEEA